MNLTTLTQGVAEAFAQASPGKSLHYNTAQMCKSVGGLYVVYDFAFAPGYANIFHNAHGLIRLMIDRKEGDGSLDIDESCPVEVDALLYDYRFRNAGIKFRKMSAKNIEEAQKKIVAWFTKNAPAMLAVEFKG